METKYYYLHSDLPSELDRELNQGGVVKDIGGNMFYSKSVSDAIEGRWAQLSPFSCDISAAYIKHSMAGISSC